MDGWVVDGLTDGPMKDWAAERTERQVDGLTDGEPMTGFLGCTFVVP